ncbi:L-serine ammonia-lyase [Methylomagnum ishizawai]|uniref:L-serine ammonia-lyase n=1 Tax=Methylomagnum ishizawai TaxID=1760988 RepID=UPI001C33DC56|nr:L-serine ammonia-lyase [Methylomagnum ishizawai]BBL73408.1 L-serine ammonia-lyase [Methylomagnum ishizawai]
MESISAFEIIKIGIGPSSSHTMGPWRAAAQFVNELGDLDAVAQINARLYGSLAKTGAGHGTDIAVLMGLSGEDYTRIDTGAIPAKVEAIKRGGRLHLGGVRELPFAYASDLVFDYDTTLPRHANGMRFGATRKDGSTVERTYYSLGGGFIATEHEPDPATMKKIVTPYPCHTGAALEDNCRKLGLSVSELTYVNEQAWRSRAEIDALALGLWKEIRECVFRGVNSEGYLPGGLRVRRRAAEMNRRLLGDAVYASLNQWLDLIQSQPRDFTRVNKWISCFALAVNEENASFGRIVTAPTNGAAGVIPAVLMYAWCFLDGFDQDKVIRFLLIAGEIGTLFKKNATISAAMGGCQAEIGVSSAMAAAGLAEALGACPAQVLIAAEIAMEHHLGLTCDPVGGLVQIPCIERNSMGAMKAITAANIALETDPKDARVSLDAVIKTMWETAQDMNSRYKETAEAGLAMHIPVSVPEC